ncbi:MAG: Hsp20/alpha crystallin family protein [Proteobacteria bacterium]|nr:Hsp20/alpha crystallin family protein [Pseudomonadota bacterium]
MIPRVDCFEQGEDLVVETELPGVAPGDIQILVDADVLCLRGRKPGARKDVSRLYHRQERTLGGFAREVPLPGRVRREGVEATLRDGVLTVRMRMEKVEIDVLPLRVPIGRGLGSEHEAATEGG